MLVRGLMALALSTTACTVDGNYSGVGFACNEEQPCATGLVCDLGTCQRAEGADVDANPGDTDAGELVDAGIIDCLPPIALSDDFEMAELAAHWTLDVANGTSVDVSGGVLALTPGLDQNQPRFAAVISQPFSFSEKRIALEIPQMVNTATPAIAEVRVGVSDQDHVFLRQAAGVLQAGVTEAGAPQVRVADTFDAGAHRWWQFRLTGGQIHADVAPDGQEWTEFAAFDVGASIELGVTIRAGTEERVGEPGSLHIDNVNSGSSLCP